VHEYLQPKQLNCAPSAKWWVQPMVLAAFSNKASATFKLLQGRSITVTAQHALINSLQNGELCWPAISGRSFILPS
jgi:hypothetical protein